MVDLPPEAPRSIWDSRTPDAPDPQLQVHSPGAGGRMPVFHGNPSGADIAKDELLRHFRDVDRGLQRVLRSQSAPLILAGVEYLMPLYKTASTYAHTLPEGIPGNPDDLKPEELRMRAGPGVEPPVRQAEARTIDRYTKADLAGRASSEIGKVLEAAFQGRVDLLIIGEGVEIWGRFNPGTVQIEVHEPAQPGDEDLIDLAAVQTLALGGTVQVLDAAAAVPGGSGVAAAFRY